MQPAILPYAEMIQRFLGGMNSAGDFERAFLSRYKEDPTPWSDELFSILDRLFFAVDAFCPDPKLRGPHDLDEAGLRAECSVALGKMRGIDALLSSHA